MRKNFLLRMETLKTMNPKYLNAEQIAHEMNVRNIPTSGKVVSDREILSSWFNTEINAPTNSYTDCVQDDEVTRCRELLINLQQIYNTNGLSSEIETRLEHLRQRVNRIIGQEVSDKEELENLYQIVYKFLIDVASDSQDQNMVNFLIQEVSKKAIFPDIQTQNDKPLLDTQNVVSSISQVHTPYEIDQGLSIAGSLEHNSNNIPISIASNTESQKQVEFALQNTPPANFPLSNMSKNPQTEIESIVTQIRQLNTASPRISNVPKTPYTGTIPRFCQTNAMHTYTTKTVDAMKQPIPVHIASQGQHSHVAPSFTLDTTDFRRYLNEETPKTARPQFFSRDQPIMSTIRAPMSRHVTYGQNQYKQIQSNCINCSRTQYQNVESQQPSEAFWTMHQANMNSIKDKNDLLGDNASYNNQAYKNCNNLKQTNTFEPSYHQQNNTMYPVGDNREIRRNWKEINNTQLHKMSNNRQQNNMTSGNIPFIPRRNETLIPDLDEPPILNINHSLNRGLNCLNNRLPNQSRPNLSVIGNMTNHSNFSNSHSRNYDDNTGDWLKKVQMVQRWNVKFSGKPGTMSLVEFIFHVSMLASTHRIDQDDLVSLAVYLLEGQALFVYKSRMQNCRTWNELVCELQNAFVIGDFDECIRERIRTRYQGQGETFGLYWSEMSLLFDCLSEGMTENEKVRRLLKNADPKIGIALATDDHKSLSSVIEKCYRLEKYFYELQNRPNTSVPEQSFYSLPDPNKFCTPYKNSMTGSRGQTQTNNIPLYTRYKINEIETEEFENLIQDNFEEISALKTQMHPSKIECFRCGENHHFLDCSKKSHPDYKNIIFCYVCGKQGTITPKCCRSNSKNYQGYHSPIMKT